ncbi:MAG: phosphate starvation-inducible protein PhoH [Rhodopirellula sp. TMED11]|nr:MAG: phosphate starvation-inducible protein PhoH [Rhodopirellula sp. TMED11]
MTEATLTINTPEELLQLFGPRDQHLRRLRQSFDVTITHRNGRIRIAGLADNVQATLKAFEALRSLIRKQGGIAADDVESIAQGRDPVSSGGPKSHGPTKADPGKLSREPSAERKRGSGSDSAKSSASKTGEEVAIGHAGRRIRPRTEGQRAYVDAIREFDLTFATGPAGCGKTYLAVATAVEAFKADLVRKIVLVRPAVEAGESLGYLPGDLRAKLNPYLRPLLDALGDMVDFDRVQQLMEQDVIEVIPLAYMRGRTLSDAFVILDEAQNTTIAQMKMFLTRMGERSKMVVSGDVTQLDLPRGVTSGLQDALRRLNRISAIGVVRLTGEDIVRHRLVQRIVDAYEESEPKGGAARARQTTVRVIENDRQPRTRGEGPLDR